MLLAHVPLWELVTPHNLRRDLQENNKVAVAVFAASFIIGMAIVVAAALVHIG